MKINFNLFYKQPKGFVVLISTSQLSALIHCYRPNIRSFGLSLSPGSDVDENTFADFLVGAPESATAVLLRSGLETAEKQNGGGT